MSNFLIIEEIKNAEQVYEEMMHAMAFYYKSRAILHSMRNKLKGHDTKAYKKYCQQARRIAKKNKPRGRGVADHIISVFTGWCLQIPPEQISKPENLELTTKKINSRKSFKSDWSRFDSIFPEFRDK